MSDSNQSFKPFIPANENPPEMTVTSVVIGVQWRLSSVPQTPTWGCGSE